MLSRQYIQRFEGQTNELFMHVFAQSCLMVACVGPMLWLLLLSSNNTPQCCLKYSWPGRPITLSHCGFLIMPSSPRFTPPVVTVFHSLHPANLSVSGCASHSRPAWSSKCHHQMLSHSEFLFSSVTFWNFFSRLFVISICVWIQSICSFSMILEIHLSTLKHTSTTDKRLLGSKIIKYVIIVSFWLMFGTWNATVMCTCGDISCPVWICWVLTPFLGIPVLNHSPHNSSLNLYLVALWADSCKISDQNIYSGLICCSGCCYYMLCAVASGLPCLIVDLWCLLLPTVTPCSA